MIRSLIQALYDPGTPLPEEEVFYEQVLGDKQFIEVSPTIYYLLKQRGRLGQTPPIFADRLKQVFDDTVYRNLFIKHQMNQLLSLFEERRIPVIPLKGTRFAETYFGHIGARVTSDIDLLLHERDLEQAMSCVKSQGYTIEQGRVRSHFHWSLSKPLPHGTIPLTVELHWGLLRERTSGMKMRTFWEKAVPMDPYTCVMELSGHHTFYHICLHGWSHKLNSLKHVLDILQLVHTQQSECSYDRLLQDAAAHQTSRRITRTLGVIAALFPNLPLMAGYPKGKLAPPWLDRVYYELFDFDSVKHMLASLAGASYLLFYRLNSLPQKVKKL